MFSLSALFSSKKTFASAKTTVYTPSEGFGGRKVFADLKWDAFFSGDSSVTSTVVVGDQALPVVPSRELLSWLAGSLIASDCGVTFDLVALRDGYALRARNNISERWLRVFQAADLPANVRAAL